MDKSAKKVIQPNFYDDFLRIGNIDPSKALPIATPLKLRYQVMNSLANAVFLLDRNIRPFWASFEETEFVNHIIQTHLKPETFKFIGIPNFDIELAVTRGFNLQPICQTIYTQLKGADAGQQEFLIKTLLFIDSKKPGTVDWTEIPQKVPNYQHIQLDPLHDIQDHSFSKMLDTRIALHKNLGFPAI